MEKIKDINAIAEIIEVVFLHLSMLDKDELNSLYEKMDNDVSTFDSCATIVGPGYLAESKKRHAETKRMKALVELINVMYKTQDELDKSKKMKENDNKIKSLFGM